MGSAHQLFATTSLAQHVFQSCGTRGIILQGAIDRGDFMSVVEAEMPNPMDYNSPLDFAQAYQAWSLLRKFDSFPVDIDRRAVATFGFEQSEVSCGRINSTVGALPYVPGVHLARQQQSIVELAQSIIKNALGRFDWEEFQMACDFSNGASTRCPRKRGNPVYKLEGKPHVTINCRDLAVHFIWCNEAWRKHFQDKYGKESDPYTWVDLVPGSRFTTVPKDSLKDRPICIEPELNMFFQKGIGKMLKRRLRRRGINLSDQTRNQLLAKLGSKFGHLATIDLSAASDSIALALVELLLPSDWYGAMLTTRSAYVQMDGGYKRLEKISSMGNGFTFELESLIFWALSLAVCITHGEETSDLSVYGDDIIVPVGAAEPLIGVLRTLGFETNANKTFSSGPFRESCGKHYFTGADVTPFKIESPIETWADLYHFANNVQEWGWISQSKVDDIVSSTLRAIPPRNRCYVPKSYGSKTGLRCDVPRVKPRYCPKLGSHVWKFQYMQEETNDHNLNGPVAYLASLLLREQRTPSSVSDVETFSVPLPLEPHGLEGGVSYDLLSTKRDTFWRIAHASTSVWSDIAA